MSQAARDRKAEMIRAGVSQTAVAAAMGTTRATVSRVVAGHGIRWPIGQRIALYIAGATGKAVADLWPELDDDQRAA